MEGTVIRGRSRRAALGLFVAAALVVSACGDDEAGGESGPEAQDGSAEAGGEWSFTDDRGVEVTLPERPERIVAYHNAAAALLPLGVQPVAVFGGSAPENSSLLSGLDIDGIESVGETYGELNFEALAAVDPDLIVTLFDPAQEGPAFGFLENAQETAEEVAPVVALDGAADPVAGIERFEELAAALGADLDAPEVTADREAFDAAFAELEDAVAAKPGVRALAFQVYPGDGIYFARPDAFPSLRLLRDAGLDIVEPDGDPGDVNDDFVNYFWDFVSLEHGGKYPADLALLGNNEGAMNAEQVLDVATLAAHPAIAAGQTVTWQVLDRYSYRAFTAQLEEVAAAVAAADPATVP
jgi:iron complex transport system substrate-binding protein